MTPLLKFCLMNLFMAGKAAPCYNVCTHQHNYNCTSLVLLRLLQLLNSYSSSFFSRNNPKQLEQGHLPIIPCLKNAILLRDKHPGIPYLLKRQRVTQVQAFTVCIFQNGRQASPGEKMDSANFAFLDI